MSLLDTATVAAKIQKGEVLLLAGDEKALACLPRGHWIGGTIPYFMTPDGGRMDRERVFVNEVPAETVKRFSIRSYDADAIRHVYEDAKDNGLSGLILPALSPVHLAFANGAPSFPGFAQVPLFGWVSGVPVESIGALAPKVFDGESGAAFGDRAVALHVELDPAAYANVDLVNLFEPGDGDVLTFPRSGFTVDEVLVGGRPARFADYLVERKVDTKVPLVADYCGARVNVSFQAVDPARGEVKLYAPVFEGIEYRLAKPVLDYAGAFAGRLGGGSRQPLLFACNCVLNYLYAGLEGKKTAPYTGPITFGEIAYQLLNQTLVFVEVGKRPVAS